MKTNERNTQQIIKQAVDGLMAALEAGQSEQLKAYLGAMGRFHRYSWGNVLLIHMGCPGASHVAGYRAWQRLGRQVRRGAQAIRIMAPILRKDPKAQDRERVVAYKTACVFDISQTEGKPLPEFAAVSGDPGTHLASLKEYVRSSGIALERSARTGEADGMSLGGRIVLKAGLEPAAEFAVLAHELAHELLHRDTETRPGVKTVRETEAEAVAFVVCRSVGLQANGASSDYIQLYDGNKDTLLASLERVQQTAATIIRGMAAAGANDVEGNAAFADVEAIEPLPRV